MVKIYTTPNCQGCRASKRFMDDRGIAYEPIDITEDEAAHAHVKALGHTSAPVLELPNGESWSGFRPDKLATLVS